MNSTLYFSILLCVQFVFRIVFSNLNIGVYGGVDFDHIPVLIITPIVGVSFWLRVVKLLTPLLKDVKWFIYIGKNTMSIMIHHLFAIFIMQAVLCFIHCNTTMLSGFDVTRYASSVYYVYAPNPAMKLIYAIFSVAMILLVVYGVEQLKRKQRDKSNA